MDPIAICGIGCHLPGANSAAEFWRMLMEGRVAIGPPPAGRTEVGSFAGGYLDDVSLFDASFFGISPREAKFMDPQQRLMLEAAAAAIEDAGTPAADLAGARTGVFVGISTHDYAVLYWSSGADDPAAAPGTSNAAAANRISSWLGASGPSMAIDAACCSALTALYSACSAIRNDEIDCAIVGGVSVLLLPAVTKAFQRAGMISPSGRCRSFDRSADGYVRSEGAAAVLLKRLEVARERRDRIYAVVRGCAVNHNGSSNGLGGPSPWAQAAVIRAACADAGISTGTLQYVEGMGSATALGDALEVKGLRAAMAGESPKCVLGSVKANLGHQEAASGMTSLIKTALAIYHSVIPPTPGGAQAPAAAVNRSAAPWPEAPVRVAGVSSFSFAGANAHAVLGEAPARPEAVRQTKKSHVLLLSARSEEALDLLVQHMADFLRRSDDSTARVCFTASAGRDHHRYRAAVVGSGNRELAEALGHATPSAIPNRPPKIAFVLPGGRELSADDHRLLHELGAAHPALGAALERSETTEAAFASLFLDLGLIPAAMVCESAEQIELCESILKAADRIQIPIATGSVSGIDYHLRLCPRPDFVSLWADLYLAGAALRWERLYAGWKIEKTTIPGHPRIGRRYWFKEIQPAEEKACAGTILAEIERELDLLGY